MIVLLVSMHAKREHLEAFRQATIENATNSRREPGVARFDFIQQSDDPTHFRLYEVYRDQAALAAHRESPHYKAWNAKTADMFESPRTRQMYVSVDPPEDMW